MVFYYGICKGCRRSSICKLIENLEKVFNDRPLGFPDCFHLAVTKCDHLLRESLYDGSVKEHSCYQCDHKHICKYFEENEPLNNQLKQHIAENNLVDVLRASVLCNVFSPSEDVFEGDPK